MHILRTAAASITSGALLATAFVFPASAYSTTYKAKNSGESYTGAIFHSCTKGKKIKKGVYLAGKLTGPARVAEPGETKKVKGYVSGYLCSWVPKGDAIRVTKDNVKTVTIKNTTGAGHDFVISRAAYTRVVIYKL